MYTYKYERPALTVDIVLFDRRDDSLKVLLIKRKNDPYKDRWAFPGGFLDMGETVENAALRELEEETGLKCVNLEQLRVFSQPERDPREHTVTVAFYGFINEDKELMADSDAADAKWFSVDNLPQLAFDHIDILKCALEKI